VIRNVFVHAGIDDICDVDGLDVFEQYEEPHRDDGDGKTVPDIEHCFVLQGIADGYGSDDETGVGENHSPPTEMEVDSPGVDNLKVILVIVVEMRYNGRLTAMRVTMKNHIARTQRKSATMRARVLSSLASTRPSPCKSKSSGRALAIPIRAKQVKEGGPTAINMAPRCSRSGYPTCIRRPI
jgi:hypothetical protein